MWNTKLGLGTSRTFGIDIFKQIELFHNTGFEAFFVCWEEELDFIKIKEYGDSLGMIFQSIHAPFGCVDSLWEEDDRTTKTVDTLLRCVEDCAAANVPIMVCHAFIGFEKHSPTLAGINNFRKIVEKAQALGVKIAFENTEGEEYLAALMEAFKDNQNVGFCWDTGHEMCYNHSKDMLALYGDRLIATHIDDNLGIKDYNGKTTPIDDLHLLPFDGIANWENIVGRLNKYGFDDILTFELNIRSKPGRHENDKYLAMPLKCYIAEAYARACRVATMKLNNKNYKGKI